MYSALEHPESWGSYSATLEALIAAGADIGAVTYPTGNERVDELLERHGAGGSAPV
jgi:hypothetical protein